MPPSNEVVTEGTDLEVVFLCTASGLPRPDITWFFTDPESDNSTEIVSDRMNYEINDTIAPVITSPPVDVEVVENSSVLFSCEATGRPRPQITWFRDSSQNMISESDDISISVLEIGERELMSNLSLNGVLPSDAGVYI